MQLFLADVFKYVLKKNCEKGGGGGGWVWHDLEIYHEEHNTSIADVIKNVL